MVGCAGSMEPDPLDAADLVFYGGQTLTVDPQTANAEAVAVRGASIVAVGSKRDIEGLIGDKTRVVELGERALVPGFIDAHGHLGIVMQTLDLVNASSPPVGPMNKIEDILDALRARIEEQNIPPGVLVMGYGYDDSLLEENRHLDRDDLDRVSLDHPIALLHVSGHLATANSAALRSFGIDAETPDPSGGLIRRRPGGREPNGVLEEAAVSGALRRLLGGGSSPEKFAKDLDRVGYRRDYENGVRVAGVKFVLDGSPKGRTAWLSRPYDEGPPGVDAEYVAYPTTDPDHYRSLVSQLISAGISVLAHANGDAAIDLMVDGIDRAVSDEQLDHRSVTIHAQLACEDQLDEMKRLGIVPSFFSVHTFFWGDWHRKRFGDDRALRISPLRSAIDRGLPFTIHNDEPIVPADIMRLLQAAVERRTRSGFILGEDQRIGFEQALHAVTLGTAYAYFEEDRKGSITVGKQADLVILAADPRTTQASEIGEIAILETIARGRTVYTAPGIESSPSSER